MKESGAAGRDLRIGVGGHDRFRRILPEVRLRLSGHIRQNAGEFGGIERLADHAGGGEVDVARRASGCLGGGFRCQRGRLLALLAGEGVGIA